MTRRTSLIVVAAVLVLAASGQALAQATTITLEVGSGPHQGRYETASRDVTCTYGFAGEGLWGNQYSIDTTDADVFSSLQLIVDTRAAAQGTAEFLTTISFGPLFTPQETRYEVNTRSAEEGRGTVTVDDRGNSGTVHISAVTADGTPLEATIECHTVLRAGASVEELERAEEEAAAPAGPLSLTLDGQSFELLPSSEEAYCSEALAESHDFQYSYYPLEYDGARITGVEVYLYDVRRPDEGGFYVSISTADDSYYLDTSEEVGDGSGTARFGSQGEQRSVEVSATTAEGVPVQLTLQCRVE
ncbi:MAG TPA: hypothetical protein VF168_14220 [Trueperaceae bacterium]